MVKTNFGLTNYISIKIFVASFLIGLLLVYIVGPQTKKVIVYPSPETINRAIFQDNSKSCFLYNEEIVECPLDKKEITTIPIQQ